MKGIRLAASASTFFRDATITKSNLMTSSSLASSSPDQEYTLALHVQFEERITLRMQLATSIHFRNEERKHRSPWARRYPDFLAKYFSLKRSNIYSTHRHRPGPRSYIPGNPIGWLVDLLALA